MRRKHAAVRLTVYAAAACRHSPASDAFTHSGSFTFKRLPSQNAHCAQPEAEQSGST
jgi:hypothetical protein